MSNKVDLIIAANDQASAIIKNISASLNSLSSTAQATIAKLSALSQSASFANGMNGMTQSVKGFGTAATAVAGQNDALGNSLGALSGKQNNVLASTNALTASGKGLEAANRGMATAFQQTGTATDATSLKIRDLQAKLVTMSQNYQQAATGTAVYGKSTAELEQKKRTLAASLAVAQEALTKSVEGGKASQAEIEQRKAKIAGLELELNKYSSTQQQVTIKGKEDEAQLARRGVAIDKVKAQLAQLTAETQKSESVLNAQANVSKNVAAAFESLGTKAGQVATAIGKVALAAGAAGLVALGAGLKSSIGVAAEFETTMNVLQAATGATDGKMRQVSQAAKALGADLELPNTSASGAAKAITELAKGGLSLDQAMAAAKGTLQLATIGMMSEAQAAEITSGALNMFKMSGQEASTVTNLLAAAANASSGDVKDFADAMRMGGSVAAMAKVPLSDFTTAAALMAQQGIKGSDAGTSLKTMFLRLQAPTNDAKALMDSYGISVYDTEGKMKPLPNIMKQFSSALSDNSTKLVTVGGATKKQASDAEKAAGQQEKLTAAIGFGNRQLDIAQRELQAMSGKAKVSQTAIDAKKLSIDKLKASLADKNDKLTEANGKIDAYAQAAGTSREAVIRMTQEQRNQTLSTIFGTDAIRAANAVLMSGEEAWNDMSESVNKAGAANDAAAAQTKGLAGAWQGFKSQVETVALTIGEPFLRPLTAVMVAMSEWVGGVGANVEAFLGRLNDSLLLFSDPLDALKQALLTTFSPSVWGFIDSGIKTLKDLRDIAISVGKAFGGDLKGAFVDIAMILGFTDDEAMGMVSTFSAIANTVMSVLAPAMEFVKSNFSAIATAVGIAVAAFGGLSIISTVVGFVTSLGGVMGALSAIVAGVVTALGGPLVLAIAGVALAAGALYLAWQTNFGGIRDTVAEYMPQIENLLANIGAIINEGVIPALVFLWNRVQEIFAGIVAFLSAHSAEIQTVLSAAWTVVSTVVSNALTVIKGIVNTVLAAIRGDWQGAWDALSTMLATVAQNWATIISSIFTAIKGVIVVGVQAWIAAMIATWTPAIEKVSAIWTAIGAAIETFLISIGETLKSWFTAITTAWGTFWTGVANGLDTATGGISTVIISWFSSMWASWTKFWNSIGKIVEDFGGKIVAFLGGIFGGIATAWNTFWGGLTTSPQKALGATATDAATAMGQLATTMSGVSVKTSWNDAWTGMSDAPATEMQAALLSTSTEAARMQNLLSTFSANAKPAWKSSWTGMSDAPTTEMQAALLTTSTNANELKNVLATFSSTARPVWDSGWTGMSIVPENEMQAAMLATSTEAAKMQNLLGAFSANAKPVWDSGWTGMSDAPSLALTNVNTTTSGKMAELGAIFTSTGASLGGVFEGLWTGITTSTTNAFNGIVERVPAIFDAISATITAKIALVLSSFSEFGVLITQSLMVALEPVISTIVSWGATLSVTWAAVWNGLSLIVTNVFTAISGVVLSGISIVSGAITAASAVISGAWSAVWTGLSLAVETALGAVVTVITAWAEFAKNVLLFQIGMVILAWQFAWSQLQPIVQPILDAVSVFITTTLTTIQTTITTILTAISTTWAAVWNGLSLIVNSVMMGILAVITPILTEIQTFIATTWQTVSDTTTAVFTAISTTATTIWTAISTTISGVLTALQATITATWAAIVAGVSAALQTMQATINSVMAAISAAINSAWTSISTAVSGVLAQIQAKVSAIWNDIKSTTTTVYQAIQSVILAVWTQIYTAVSTKLSAILAEVQTVFNQILTTITTIANNILTAIINAFSQMVTAVTTKMQEIHSIIQDKLAGALNSARQFIGEAVGIGRDIIGGMIQGITSKAGEIAEAAANVVSKAISAAKNALGIQSPSKEFAYLGDMSAAGYIKALNGNEQKVVAASTQVIDSSLAESRKRISNFSGLADDVENNILSIAESIHTLISNGVSVDKLTSEFDKLRSTVSYVAPNFKDARVYVDQMRGAIKEGAVITDDYWKSYGNMLTAIKETGGAAGTAVNGLNGVANATQNTMTAFEQSRNTISQFTGLADDVENNILSIAESIHTLISNGVSVDKLTSEFDKLGSTVSYSAPNFKDARVYVDQMRNAIKDGTTITDDYWKSYTNMLTAIKQTSTASTGATNGISAVSNGLKENDDSLKRIQVALEQYSKAVATASNDSQITAPFEKLMTVVQSVAPRLTNVRDIVGYIGDAIKDAGKDSVEFKDTVDNLYQSIAKSNSGMQTFNSTTQNASKAMQPVQAAVAQFANALSTAGNDAQISAQFENLVSVVQSVAPKLTNVREIVGYIGDAIKDAGKDSVEFKDTVDNLYQSIAKSNSGMQTFNNTAKASLGTASQGASGWAGVVDIAKQQIQKIAEIAGAGPQAMATANAKIAALSADQITTWGDLSRYITAASGAIRRSAHTDFEATHQLGKGATKAMREAVANEWAGISADITKATADGRNAAKDGFNGLKEDVKAAAAGVKTSAAGMLDGIKDTITNESTGISELVKSTFKGMTRDTQDTNTDMNRAISATWREISRAVDEQVKAMKASVAGGSQEQKDAMNQQIAELRESVATKWRDMKYDVTDAVRDMKRSVGDEQSQINEFMKTSLAGIKDKAKEEWNAAKNEADAAIKALKAQNITDFSEIEAQLALKAQAINDNTTQAYDDLKSQVGQKLADLRGSHDSSWQGILGLVMGVTNDIKGNVPTKYGEMGSAIKKILDEIDGANKTTMTSVQTTTKTAMDATVSTTKAAMDVLTGATTQGSANAIAASKLLQEATSQNFDQLYKSMQSALESGTKLTDEELSKWMEIARSKAGDLPQHLALSGLEENIKKSMSAATTAVANGSGGISAAAKVIAEANTKTFDQMYKDMEALITSGTKLTDEETTKWLEIARTKVGDLPQALALNGLEAKIRDQMAAAATAVATGGGGISEAAKVIADANTRTFDQMYKDMEGLITSGTKLTSDEMTKWLDIARTKVGDLPQAMALNGLEAKIREQLGAAATAMQQGSDSVTGAAKLIADANTQTFDQMYKSMQTLITTGAKITDDELAKWLELAKQRAGDLPQVMALNDLEVKLRGQMVAITKGLQSPLDEAKIVLPAAAAAIAEGIEQPINNLPEAVRPALIRVRGVMSDEMQGTVTTTRNVGPDMYNAGISVMDGLINGMSSKLAQLEALSIRIGQTIEQATNQSLGIASPSKVTTWQGKMIGEGWVKGIASMTPSLANAVTAISDTMQVDGAMNMAYSMKPQAPSEVASPYYIVSRNGDNNNTSNNRIETAQAQPPVINIWIDGKKTSNPSDLRRSGVAVTY